MNHRILVVDPHPLTLNGYDNLLRTEPDLTLIEGAQTGTDALTIARVEKPDLIVMELHLEKGGGFELVKQFNTIDADIRVLVVSQFEDTIFGSRALKAGARGYLQKESDVEDVLAAIRTILDGGIYLSDSLEEIVMKTYIGQESGVSMEQLTDRELEIFKEIGAGLSTREIADRLHISIKTVQTHRANIMEKLGIDMKEKLIRHAVIWSLENAL